MEKLMQYVWQHRLWLQRDMRTVDGEPVEVIDQGLLNTDAGPDFFNAKVRIGDRTWAGNVEIHVRASDWHRHGHDRDRAYDSVVLHVVGVNDVRVTRPDGREIPQLLMPCARDFSERYSALVDNPASELACADELPNLPDIYLTDWMTNLAHERLIEKSDRILDYLRRLDGDWQATVYVTLARALGFSVNSDAFERLAFAAPLAPMMKHRESLSTVEGLLFGQAGMIPDTTDPTDYPSELRREHQFMCRKFGIEPPGPLGWRMARTRPQNFPQRRIAALARLIHDGFAIGRNVFGVATPEEASELFRVMLSGYWERRYTFGPEANAPTAAMSQTSIDILTINVVAPLIYAFGQSRGDTSMMQRAVDLLGQLKPETNRITSLFVNAGVRCRDALSSQALIQLRRNYCEPRKCLYCRIGHRLLAARVRP